jgi:hypothetical protein
MQGVSAMFNYLDSSRASAVTPAVGMAGFPMPRWGENSRASSPPSLAIIITEQAAGSEDLQQFVDELFQLDSSSMPELTREGRLRPMAEASLAALIMYYEERSDVGTCERVLEFMRDSWIKIFYQGTAGAPATRAANSMLTKWSGLIKAAFDASNAPLNMRESARRRPSAPS